MRLSLIGGSGGLGSILADHLLAQGHEARRWSRASERSLDVLHPDPPREAFEADRVVYLAWSTSNRSPEIQNQHAEAAVRWSEISRTSGVPFVFVSTVLASASAASEYGRAKWIAERGVRARNGGNVRVGLVVDDGYPELLASRLRRFARRAKWSSSIGAWPVLPIAGETAARIILEECAQGDAGSAPILAAERSAVPLATIMSSASNPTIASWSSGVLTGLARRYPTSRGAIGRHVDALRGLALTQIDLEGARDPLSGPVTTGDWRRGIIPFVAD